MYRVGFPGWKLLARLGVPMLYRVDVHHDDEAHVFIATSPDVPGLVAEAKDPAALLTSVYDCMDMLMEEALKRPLKQRPLAAWSGDMLPT